MKKIKFKFTIEEYVPLLQNHDVKIDANFSMDKNFEKIREDADLEEILSTKEEISNTKEENCCDNDNVDIDIKIDDQINPRKRSKISTDSIVLMFLQGITFVVGIVKAIILSRTLSQAEYGTYEQGLLVASFIAPFLALGLGQVINFFYNKTESREKQAKYVNTIFLLTIVLGFIGVIGVMAGQGLISQYFKNPQLQSLLWYVAFMPMMTNLIALYQPLFVSNGRTKEISIINFAIAVFQILVVSLVSYYTHNVLLMTVIILGMEVAQIAIFSLYYRLKCGRINPFKPDVKLIKTVLKFAIPMGLATVVGTISIQMDKLLIGRVMSVEDFAIYSIVAKELPFSIVTSALTTVILPIIIRNLAKNDVERTKNIWSHYLEIGYTCTFVLCAGAILCSKDLLLFLYSEKYIAGLYVFIIYITVSMMRFSYFGMILTAYGKTKWIMAYSVLTLILNLIGNFLLIKPLGMIGPALSTLISIVVTDFIMYVHNVKLINGNVLKSINIGGMLCVIMAIVASSVPVYFLDKYVISVFIDVPFIRLAINYLIYLVLCGIMLGKRVYKLFVKINFEAREK